ncbi:MAG TPA: Na+/H+ antiporter NhaC family protein [Puia sp.]|nr:Na+/H+ antiporter NhaC family protein [Puia sp.]
MIKTGFGLWGFLPLAVAIGFAIWKKDVIVSLFLAIWTGASLIKGSVFLGFTDSISTYIVNKSLATSDEASVVVFGLLMGGVINIMADLGGNRAIARAFSRRIKSGGGQMATFIMGLLIFFDDYASALIVGNSMRPITDRQKVSREKLAFIVDATAAPVAATVPFSTWVAMELGLIATCWKGANPMGVLVRSIPYQFYTLFILMLVLATIILRREWGPMLRAERRAKTTGQLFAPGSSPQGGAALEAVENAREGKLADIYIPILTFVVTIFAGLWYNGYQKGFTMQQAIGNADAPVVLAWSGCATVLVVMLMTVPTKRYTFTRFMEVLREGFNAMIPALTMLVLAAALKNIITDMQLANYLSSKAGHLISPSVIAPVTFLISCLIAFTTGTSWGTCAIVVPFALPLAVQMAGPGSDIPVIVFASVLTGAVFGNHCSPIADTMILSSVSSHSDYMDHFRTQLPYGIMAMVVSLVAGFVPAAFGVPPLLSLLAGLLVLFLLIRVIGKKVIPEPRKIVSRSKNMVAQS